MDMAEQKISTPLSISEAISWYRQNKALYDRLGQTAAGLIEEALEEAHIPYHSILWRTKSVESYEKKALTRGFLRPREQIHDMSGIRVITFVQSEANAVCRTVQKIFHIAEVEDKSAQRGNSFGYRSTHFLAYLRKQQLKEPKDYDLLNLPFEIQVRTLLQHAWAEIEHDRNYKFEGTLPPDLQRRFAMLAAVLELSDREFDAIAKAIDEYVASIKAQTAKGMLDIPINTASLREYLLTRFKELIPLPLSPRFATRRDAEEIVRELHGMGIDTLAKLDNIIPPDFVEKAQKHLELSTLAAIVRDILIIHDADAYFRVTRQEHSQPLTPDSLQLFKAYNLDSELIKLKEAAVTPEAFWKEIGEAKG